MSIDWDVVCPAHRSVLYIWESWEATDSLYERQNIQIFKKVTTADEPFREYLRGLSDTAKWFESEHRNCPLWVSSDSQNTDEFDDRPDVNWYEGFTIYDYLKPKEEAVIRHWVPDGPHGENADLEDRFVKNGEIDTA